MSKNKRYIVNEFEPHSYDIIDNEKKSLIVYDLFKYDVDIIADLFNEQDSRIKELEESIDNLLDDNQYWEKKANERIIEQEIQLGVLESENECLKEIINELEKEKRSKDYIQDLISDKIEHTKVKIVEKELREVIKDYNIWLLNNGDAE